MKLNEKQKAEWEEAQIYYAHRHPGRCAKFREQQAQEI